METTKSGSDEQAAKPSLPFVSSKIMIVDDEPTTIEVLQMFLQGEGYENFLKTTDSRQAVAMVERHRPDALLLDLMMPHVGGLEILETIRNDPAIRHTPVITLTSSTDAGTKLRALELGATDFLAKPVDPSELALRLRNTLAAKAYQDRLTYYDALTNLPNRRLFLERLERTLARARSRGTHCAVLHVDLDRFQQVNDALGYGFGDALLARAARRLEETMRPTDFIGIPGMPDDGNPLSRVGGDEFSLFLPGAGAFERAARVSRRVLATLSDPFQIEDQTLFVTASVGVALFPEDGDNVEALLNNASTAMLAAKARGRDGFQFYEASLNLESAERFSLENHLRQALGRKELVLHYQPKINVVTGAVAGVEALMRWEHPELGMVSPGDFIPIAEEANLMTSIGDWALRSGCQQARDWQVAGLPPLHLSINVSTQQFKSGGLLAIVRGALEESAFDPEHLVLELTESAMMQNPDESVRVMRALKDMGVRISIDDFGTGYSSLSYLKRFPIDELKIDRSFVQGLPRDEDDAAIVTAIIAMGQALGMKTVGEGVETEEQLAFLRERGCDEFQGFLRCRAVPPDDLASQLVE